MILGFDIGNTHIIPIIFSEEGEILASFRIPTNNLMTEDSLFSTLKTLCDYNNIDINSTKDIIISSVVPHINEIFEYLGQNYFNISPKFLSLDYLQSEIIFPEIGYVEKNLGADRIADILAAKKLFANRDLIIIDFGTATTFEVVQNSTYLGGCILPGIQLSINALFGNTAKLPKIKFSFPETSLGLNTVAQIEAGIFYGNLGSIREIISEYKKVLPNALVVSTGGQGKIISNVLDTIDEYIPNLSEKGIFEFYLITKDLRG